LAAKRDEYTRRVHPGISSYRESFCSMYDAANAIDKATHLSSTRSSSAFALGSISSSTAVTGIIRRDPFDDKFFGVSSFFFEKKALSLSLSLSLFLAAIVVG